MSIKYENPKDNPNREVIFKKYLELLSTTKDVDLIKSKSSYDSFFYIGKFFNHSYKSTFLNELQKNLADIFIKTLKSLYENITILNFNNKNIEAEKPTKENDFMESIFLYILYSINILNQSEKKFSKFFLENEDGMSSIVNFLNDENFIGKHLNSHVEIFGNKTQPIKILISNLTGLSENNKDLFKNNYQKLNLNLVEDILKITKREEIKSGVAFSAYLFLSKICDDKQIETIFQNIPAKYKEYLERCAKDLSIESNTSSKAEYYTLDIDNSGIKTTLDPVLTSLCSLSSKNEKFRKIIFENFKSYLDVIFEKGRTKEKGFVLDIYINLSIEENKDINLSNKIEESMRILLCEIQFKQQNLSDDLYDKLNLLGKLVDVPYERKKTLNHDSFKSQKHENESVPNVLPSHILISYDSANEKKCNELKRWLVEKMKFNVNCNNIEDSLELIYQAIESNLCILMSVTTKNNQSIGAKFIKKKSKKMIALGESDFEESNLQKLKEKIDATNIEPSIESTEMNEIQVKIWFEREKIDSSIIEFIGTCNGQMLKQLFELKQTFPQFFTQPLKAILKNKSNQDELIKRFSEALDQLFLKPKNN